jgi:hypothetical protein
MAEAETETETADPSVRGVCTTDRITERIFAAASVYATLDSADGHALTDTADADALSFIFRKSWVAQ